jgi:hypothetical protein
MITFKVFPVVNKQKSDQLPPLPSRFNAQICKHHGNKARAIWWKKFVTLTSRLAMLYEQAEKPFGPSQNMQAKPVNSFSVSSEENFA